MKEKIFLFLFFVSICGGEFVFAEKKETVSPETYTVEKGDTLWSVARKFYGSAGEWKKIHLANPQVKNPERILIGEKLTIPGVSPSSLAVRQTKEETVTEPVKEIKTETKAEVTPQTSESIVQEEKSIITVADLPEKKKIKSTPSSFLVSETWQYDGLITGEQEKKILISQGDIVYLDIGSKKGLKPDAQCLVYRKGRSVYHPQTKKLVGRTIQRIAIIQLTEEIQENVSTARVVTSYEPLEIGDWVKIIPEE